MVVLLLSYTNIERVNFTRSRHVESGQWRRYRLTRKRTSKQQDRGHDKKERVRRWSSKAASRLIVRRYVVNMKVEKDDDDVVAVEDPGLPTSDRMNRTGEAVKQLFCGGM